MSFGLRVDRPSAIGDEGRPRAASLWIASAVVLAILGGAAYLAGTPSFAPTIATVCGLTAAGAALVRRERFAQVLAGHGMLALFGSMLALLLVPVVLDRSFGAVLAGLSLATFGVALAWADAGNAEGFDAATRASGRTVVTTFAWLAVMSVVGLVLRGVAAVGDAFVGHPDPVASVLGFLLLLAGAGISLLAALRWVPLEALVSRRRRESLAARLRTVRRRCWGVVVGSCALFAVVVALAGAGALATLFAAVPPIGYALSLLSSPVIVYPVVVGAAACLLVGVVSATCRYLTRRFTPSAAGWLAAGVVGFAYPIAAFVTVLLTTFDPLLSAIVTFSAPVVLLVFLAGCLAAISVGLLPDRAGGPALAAVGLVVTAVGGGLAGAPGPLVFACVVGAAVVWDTATFGLGLTAELGHLPETRRLELFHAVLAVGVAIVVVAVAAGLEIVRTTAFAHVGGTTALVVVALGALVLLLPLRG